MRQRCLDNNQYGPWVLGVAILGLLMISGCSNKGVYENLQHNARLACERQPPAAYDDCIEQTGRDYNSYSRERERLMQQEDN